jgi:hypothetical protein
LPPPRLRKGYCTLSNWYTEEFRFEVRRCPLRVISGQTVPQQKPSDVRSCPKADKRGCGWIVR